MTAPAAIDQLHSRVRARLASLWPDAVPEPLRILEGGHSGLTYIATAGPRKVVVKAVPPGRAPIGRHDVLRQARIIGLLARSPVPVPEIICVDETEPAWFAMSWAEGEAVEPILDGITRPADLVRQRALAATRILHHLHGVNTSLMRASTPACTATDELTTWTKVLRAGVAEFHRHGDELAAALAESAPAPVPPTLIHGDYRLGNVMFLDGEPTAVVDWEIWGIGDPRLDLGYFAVFADAGNFPVIGTPAEGMPTEPELVEAYRAVDGSARGSSAGLAWFAAMGRLKMAAIMSHNLHRHRTGRHRDDAQETLPPTIAALLENGLVLARTTRFA